MKNRWLFYLRFMLTLAFVAVAMAVSCPEPEPEPGPEPEPDTKTVERRHFEAAVREGLYVKDVVMLTYESTTFQRATNPVRRIYRIQSDDQTRYLNIRYGERIPSREGEEVECEIHYRLGAEESTTLIVKLVVIRTSEEYIWLWNEFQKVGVIARKL